MTINIHDKSTIKATGKHYNGNCKPVFCITTGEVFASLTDVAESIGTSVNNVSCAVTGKIRTCKGKRFCLISNVTDHLDEIAETIRVREEKLAKYDAIIAEEARIKAEQEAARRAEEERIRTKQRAQEKLEKCKAEYNKKLAALQEAERLLQESEDAAKALEGAIN